jgi:hypothetical protein
MAAKVFISYRRDDSAGHAGRVHDRLAQEFGANLPAFHGRRQHSSRLGLHVTGTMEYQHQA